MITWCWLAEHACIKLVSRFKRSLKKGFQKRIASEFDLNTVISSLSPGQTIATCQRNISQHCWAQHVACVWPPCCDVLRHVGCFWLKFENGKNRPNNTQHVATHRNMVAKRTQQVVPNNVATCCVGMLQSFSRGLTWKKKSTRNKTQSFGGKAKGFFRPKTCWFAAWKQFEWGRLVSNEALDRTSWPPNWKLISSFFYESPYQYYRPGSTYRPALKNSVNSVGTLRVRSGKEGFGSRSY